MLSYRKVVFIVGSDLGESSSFSSLSEEAEVDSQVSHEGSNAVVATDLTVSFV